MALERFVLGIDDADRRLDRIIRVLHPETPLSFIYKLFREGKIRVNGSKINASYRTRKGDVLELYMRPHETVAPAHDSQKRKALCDFFSSLIVLDTPDIVFVNKPRGVLSHGRGGLDEAAHAYFEKTEALSFRPAPLHRLDRNTSGLLAVSKTLCGARLFSAALKESRIEKKYIALLEGVLKQDEVWDDTLLRENKKTFIAASGKMAVTMARPIFVSAQYTLASFEIQTGRTHQIRAQAAAHGCPLAFDVKYGAACAQNRYYILHCSTLGLRHAGIQNLPPELRAPLPEDARQLIRDIFGDVDYSIIDCR